MSLSNSLFDKIIKKKCHHNDIYNNNKSNQKSYFYCYNCNNLILIDNNRLYCTYKLISEEDKNEKTEFDPIITVRQMIQRQEEQIKDINDKLVLNFSNNEESNIISNVLNDIEKNNHSYNICSNPEETEHKENEKIKLKTLQAVSSEFITINNSISQKSTKNNKLTKLLFNEETFEKYTKKRNIVLLYIHKLCSKLKYNDSTFYLSLYLLDTYLSRILSDDITERELFLVALGFFLISSKYIENDIFEPDLQMFTNIEKSLLVTMDEIRSSEVQCLILINHNLFIYSSYDWFIILLRNGIVFENEIKDKNVLPDIFMYSQKLLTILTSKFIFYKYSSLQIALSIVQLSRDKFVNNISDISKRLFELLLSLYGIEFPDYEECYNAIKKDLLEDNEDEDENEEEIYKTNNTIENTYSNTNMKTVEIKSNKNKFKVFINSNKNKNKNKNKKYFNTDVNMNMKNINNLNNNNNSKKKLKLCESPGQMNFIKHKKKFKSNDKNYAFINNNSIGLLINDNKNKKYSPNIITHNNSLHNSSFKTINYIPKEEQNLMIDCYINDKHLILSGKNQKNNGALYINYAPKFVIKNSGTNINNINYINNININNEVINLFSRNRNKKKKIHKNASSGLNFNFCYKINDNIKKNNNNEKENKRSDYNKSINNFNIKKDSNNNIHITTSQNIIGTKNTITKSFKEHTKIEKDKMEKYKTLLLLDAPNITSGTVYNRNNSNKFIMPREKENKSCNKYTYNENNLINNGNNTKKKNYKIYLGRKNETKIMNTNININLNNKLNNRKFTLNFKDIVTKKIKMEKTKRTNIFISKEKKDKKSNIKRFKSINTNNYRNNNNKKENKTHNGNYIINNKQEIINSKNIGVENNLLNCKKIEQINSRLPKLKMNKNLVFFSK